MIIPACPSSRTRFPIQAAVRCPHRPVGQEEVTSRAATELNRVSSENLSKPVQLDKPESVIRSINEFWFERAKLPQKS